MDKEQELKVVDVILQNSEKKQVFIKTWLDHIKSKDEVANFTTIIDKQLHIVKPRENEVLVPFSENGGDHLNNWIIGIDINTGKELYRKNIQMVDMIYWK